ncbi:hypothetical protein [Ensifer sp. BR816]|uniref:hypothetical protein n=1 Tax=Rhizobium sp. (strain BR816) TaxID=1057002 RepID=UPI00035D7347|nr:hypothetical protein [Ensifer sp. BR816]
MAKLTVVIAQYQKVLKSDDVCTPGGPMKADRIVTRFGAGCSLASGTGGGAFSYRFGVADREESEKVTRPSKVVVVEPPSCISSC